MDHNPFAPEHHPSGTHHPHQPHHQPTPPHHEQTPPTPPPVPTFNQNFTSPAQSFVAPAAPETSQAASQSWAATPQPAQYVPPIAPTPPAPTPTTLTPQPVVQVLSPRGVEYVFLTIALLTGAIGLISVLLLLVNGQTGFEALSFPVALSLVSVPVFGWLFLRLKEAELRNPSLSLDASKRRSTQFIQILSFATCFFTLIGFMTTIFAKLGGAYDGSIFKVFLNVLVILVVSGGILVYYWRDEHRS